MKKTLAIILVVAMIVSIIPMSVSAAVVPAGEGGDYSISIPAGITLLGAPAAAETTVNAQLIVDGVAVGPTVSLTVLGGQTVTAYNAAFPGTVSLAVGQLPQIRYTAADYTSTVGEVGLTFATLSGVAADPTTQMTASVIADTVNVRVVRDNNGMSIPVAGATVSAVDATGVTRTGTTNAAGQLAITPFMRSITIGTTYPISAVSADGTLSGTGIYTVGAAGNVVIALAPVTVTPTPTPGPGGLTANPSDTYAVDTWVFDGSGTITRSADYKPDTKVTIVAQADMGAQIQGLEIYDVTNGVLRYDYARGGFVNGSTSRLFTVVKSGSDKMTITIDAIDRDYEIVATYTESLLPVVVRTNGGGTAKIIDGDNLDGKTVTIEATPFAGYEFAGWDVESVKGTAEQIVSKAGTKFSWLINYGYHGQVVFTANFVRVSGGQAAADVDGILPPNNGVASGSNNPKTGDTNVIVWALVGIVALGAVAFAAKKASAR